MQTEFPTLKHDGQKTPGPTVGDASAVTLLLSDFSHFGLSERVCYHFDLIETLISNDKKLLLTNQAFGSRHQLLEERQLVAGVAGLLECVPSLPLNKLTKPQRKALRTRCRTFNQNAQEAHSKLQSFSYEPKLLPLRLSTTTRLAFVYKETRVVFCLDASPTLVSTFGTSHDDEECCALDRLPVMAGKFFKGLVEPVATPHVGGQETNWKPMVIVTVLAVFPRNGDSLPKSSLLVRDFRVHDVASASLLTRKIREWCLGEIESQIATRLSNKSCLFGRRTSPFENFDSDLSDILNAADVALNLMPSAAKPLVVIATDGRAVCCPGILNLISDPRREDVPVTVLDLSSPRSHNSQSDRPEMTNETQLLIEDFGSPLSFPLHLADSSSALFGICKASGGCFFDSDLLSEAINVYAGQVESDSALAVDQYLSFRRRSLRPSALQWYILFSLSPLTPLLSPAWGKLTPPLYLRNKLGTVIAERLDSYERSATQIPKARHTQGGADRATFSTYIVSQIRLKSLLTMRAREGFRARRYGQNTQDVDKVSILFTLPLENGVVVLYELSYRASNLDTPLVGVAHIKIELSGDAAFVSMVKDERGRPVSGSTTMIGQFSGRLRRFLQSIREEDCLQPYISPITWPSHLSNPISPFLKRLSSLSTSQRRRHFRRKEFEVVCTGLMPFDKSEELPLIAEFDTGEGELVSTLADWSTQVLLDSKLFLKRVDQTQPPAYCMVELKRWKDEGSRLYIVQVDFVSGLSVKAREAILLELREVLSQSKLLQVLANPMRGRLVRKSLNEDGVLVRHFHRESWDLTRDPELLTLLERRRSQIGKFVLVESKVTKGVFAKFAPSDDSKELYLVQYEIEELDEYVVINMYVEIEAGRFLIERHHRFGPEMSIAQRFFVKVKRRDQECSVALRSRTRLLSVLKSSDAFELHKRYVLADVERLLAYSSRQTKRLRFFKCAVEANAALESLTAGVVISASKETGSNGVFLDIGKDVKVSNEDSGLWFLVNFDRHTLSIVNLSGTDNRTLDSNESIVRDLTFFCVGISDLYCLKNDVADDDSTDDHISEYLVVSEFGDVVEAAHGKNFATASYLALRDSAGQDEIRSLDKNDLDYALSFCHFVEVSTYLISREVTQSENNSRLVETILSSLSLIPGSESIFFYNRVKTKAIESSNHDELDLYSLSSGDSDDLDEEAGDYHGNDSPVVRDDFLELDDQNAFVGKSVIPPVFVKFFLDDEESTIDKISKVGKSSNLSVLVSVFAPTDTTHSMIHQEVITELDLLLKAYVAEEALERLRNLGHSIQDVDLKTVQRCLRRARDVLLSVFELHFYNAKTDRMTRAAGKGSILVEAYDSLATEFQKIDDFAFRQLSVDTFCVLEGNDTPFWCFVSIKRQSGNVTMEVYHAYGKTMASGILAKVYKVVASCAHRVNQLLLLKTLHRNRFASSFLVSQVDHEESADMSNKHSHFRKAYFECPDQFKKSFELFHRCGSLATVRVLEGEVLHSFAVSNVSSLFVYKDESGSVFYLTIAAKSEKSIVLVAKGIGSPGPSISNQLVRLLSKRIHMYGVEVLSSVLIKSPRLSWKREDLEFVHGSVEADDSRTKIYRFPEHVYDPIALLLYFRQNLRGSTFFHRLLVGEDNNMSPDFDGDQVDLGLGVDVAFDKNEFLFFYNNTPSPIDKDFQPACTLTSKGAEYTRKAGNGVAIIQTTLLRNGDPIHIVSAGAHPQTVTVGTECPDWYLSLQRVDRTADLEEKGLALKIEISNTTLDIEIIHLWVELTLNQVLVGWTLERHLERMSNGQLRRSAIVDSRVSDPKIRRRNQIDLIRCGVRFAVSVLEQSYSLPHPAVLKLENSVTIKASEVALSTLAVLESILMKSFFGDQARELVGDVLIIRMSRHDPPAEMKAQQLESFSSRDSPVDCPEYFCFWFTVGHPSKHLKKFFQEVAVDDRVSERQGSLFAKSMRALKSTSPSVFQRSLGFVLTVKRNKRTLLAYNWDPKVVSEVTLRLQEAEGIIASTSLNRLELQQRRCLGNLSPTTQQLGATTTANDLNQNKRPKVNSAPRESVTTKESTVMGPPQRRIRRPIIIRQPKLVGKSVDGAAKQAMAASRARASSLRTKPTLMDHNQNMKYSRRRHQSEKVPSTGSVSGGPSEAAHRSRAERGDDPLNAKDLNVLRKALSWKRNSITLQPIRSSLVGRAWRAGGSSTFSRNFILSQATPLWSMSETLVLNESSLATDFPLEYASFLAKDLERATKLPVRLVEGAKNCQLLSVPLRSNVRLVVKLTVANNSKRRLNTISSQGWLLQIPVPDGRKAKKKNRNRNEKRCASTDMKVGYCKSILSSTTQLKNFCASTIKNLLSTRDKQRCDKAFIVLRHMINAFSLDDQSRMRGLDYNFFEVAAVLKSFQSKLVDKYLAHELFDELKLRSEGYNLFECGPGLSFQQDIFVQGLPVKCILTCPNESELKGAVLCRTEGRNIQEYMFPDGSNFAKEILEVITVEIAKATIAVLDKAALRIEKDRLWHSFSTKRKDRNACPSLDQYHDLLWMCSARSLLEHREIQLVCCDNELFSWKSCLRALKRDSRFFPSWGYDMDPHSHTLFYLKEYDTFVQFVLTKTDGKLKSLILLAEGTQTEKNVFFEVGGCIASYIVHFLWKTL